MNMPLALLNRRRRGGSFSPYSLFSSTAIGIWLDPSDLSTMFSDRAGTTPVTTPGTVVGLRLDKSKGLALGAELVTNGDFSSGTTGWSAAGNAGISAVGGRLRIERTDTTNFPRALFNITGLTAGKSYLVTGQTFSNGISCKIDVPGANAVPFSAADRNLSFYFHNGGTTITVEVVFNGGAGAIGAFIEADNISVRELPGNHAVAPTDAARPTYGIEPKGGRRNLLLQTESFGDIAWTKTSLTVSGNQVSYAGGLGGTKECVQLVTIPGGTASKVLTAYVTVSGSGTFRLKNTHSGVLDNFSANVTATGTRQTIALTVTNSASAGNGLQAISIINSTGDAAFSLTVHEFQLELSATATPYQRTTTAYDVTESGVATCHYVQYDGSDDSMSTAAIDFTATDKMSVFAGVRKLSDAAISAIIGLSGTPTASAGTFELLSPTTNGGTNYRMWSGGTSYAGASAAGYGAPISNVVTGLGDISGDRATLRINGAQVAQDTADQGTGNFGNYPLYIGRRNNATLPFNGKDFGIIVVGKAASAGEITDTETWLAAKTSGVTLP